MNLNKEKHRFYLIEDGVKVGRVTIVGVREPILARRSAVTWLAKRLVRCLNFKGKSL